MKTLDGGGAASLSPSRRRRPRFSLRARKKKDGAIRGKLRLRSLAGAFLTLGVAAVTLGAALAVAGYRMSRGSAARGDGVSQPAGDPSRGAQGSPSSLGQRMKLLGPVIMGAGLFILICANTVLYENRDRETRALLAQTRGVIRSISAAVPSAELRETAVANFVSKRDRASTPPAARLDGPVERQPALAEALRPARSHAPAGPADFGAAFESEASRNTRPDAPLAKLNRRPMSAGSVPAAGRPRRCHSMSYRTKAQVGADRARSAFASALGGEGDGGDRALLWRVSVDVASEGRAHQSWPRLDQKLENKEDSVDTQTAAAPAFAVAQELWFGTFPVRNT